MEITGRSLFLAFGKTPIHVFLYDSNKWVVKSTLWAFKMLDKPSTIGSEV